MPNVIVGISLSANVDNNEVIVLEKAILISVKVTCWIHDIEACTSFHRNPHVHAMTAIQSSGVVMSPLYFFLFFI